MRRLAMSCIALVFASSVAVPRAFAQWPQGLVVQTGTSGGYFGVTDAFIVPGDAPSDFFALYGARGSGGTYWHVQHVATNGSLLWTVADATLQSGDPYNAREIGPLFTPTASGFVSPFWHVDPVTRKGGVYVSFGDALGNISPAASPYGVLVSDQLSSTSARPVGTCRRVGGGAWIGWSVSNRFWLLPYEGDHAPVPGWPTKGARLPATIASNTISTPTLQPDGSGLLLGFGDANWLPRVVRIASDTTIAAGWPASGLLLSDSVYVLYAPVQFVPSGPSHWFAVWSNGTRMVVKRFASDGTFDPAWPASGVQFVRSGFTNLKTFSDGAGGVTIGWSETEAFAMTHVLADGSSPGLYAAGPRVIVSPSNFSDNLTHVGVCRGMGDGAIVIYSKGTVFGTNAIWLDGNGWSPNRAPGDTLASVPLSTDFGVAVAAESDGYGGAYYLLFGATAQYSWLHQASHVDYLGIPTTGVTPAAVVPGLALSLGPNPARDALTVRFTLASATRARVELLDLAGRRIASREVTGAGAHAETFGALAQLPPGLYLARVTSPEGTRGARFVLTR